MTRLRHEFIPKRDAVNINPESYALSYRLNYGDWEMKRVETVREAFTPENWPCVYYYSIDEFMLMDEKRRLFTGRAMTINENGERKDVDILEVQK